MDTLNDCLDMEIRERRVKDDSEDSGLGDLKKKKKICLENKDITSLSA